MSLCPRRRLSTRPRRPLCLPVISSCPQLPYLTYFTTRCAPFCGRSGKDPHPDRYSGCPYRFMAGATISNTSIVMRCGRGGFCARVPQTGARSGVWRSALKHPKVAAPI